jgi:hypothetical protein
MPFYLHYQLLGVSSVGITHNDVVYGPIVVIGVMPKETSPPRIRRGAMWLWMCHAILRLVTFKPILLRLYITPWRIIEIHPNTCSVTISQIWSTLARNMSSVLSAKWNYSTRTNWRLTVNYITQYRWMKRYDLIGFYHLQDGIDPNLHCSTSVGAPEWPLISLVN